MKKGERVSRKDKEFREKLIIFLVCTLIVYSVALIAGIFSSAGIDSLWYAVVKPALAPSNWVFIVIWNVLYFLIVLSLYLSWTACKNHKCKLMLVFGVNLFLDILWTFLFFFMREPVWAFVSIIALWISIIFMIFLTHRVNKTASYLLLPYFFWVSFAAALNFLIAFPGV